MSRYFTKGKNLRPRADWLDEEYPLIPPLTVDDHEATDTGILDGDGDTIWRAPNPMGFIWNDG
ncbi:hypothetical protein [Sphingomonas sp.]|uniref:hypothetical protein n=1 Tax=Sphingomonas sp. TaxID=28214 RepID=UPI0031D4C1E7